MRTRHVLVAAAAGLAAAAPAAAAAPPCRGDHWVGAWAASPSNAQAPGFADQSLRLVVRPTLGGRRLRVRLSNRFGTRPVTFAAVTVGHGASGAAVVPGSLRRLRFSGRRSVTVAAGRDVRSEPVGLRVRPFARLAVSLHVRGATGPASTHLLALQTSYATPPGAGDRTGERDGASFTRGLASWPFLAGVETRAPRRTGAVVTFGDSITDGFGSTADADARYPDVLARRLAAARGPGRPLGVLNAGISANTVLRDFGRPFGGPSALHRLRRDVLGQAGATDVLVAVGTNDLAYVPPAGARAVIAGLRRIAARLHAAGLRVVLGTQTPAGGATGGHGSPPAIAARARINRSIRTTRVADGVADFDAAVRDPRDPRRLRPAFDSGDHLHPGDAGYAAMARAVDLRRLRGPACRR